MANANDCEAIIDLIKLSIFACGGVCCVAGECTKCVAKNCISDPKKSDECFKAGDECSTCGVAVCCCMSEVEARSWRYSGLTPSAPGSQHME